MREQNDRWLRERVQSADAPCAAYGVANAPACGYVRRLVRAARMPAGRARAFAFRRLARSALRGAASTGGSSSSHLLWSEWQWLEGADRPDPPLVWPEAGHERARLLLLCVNSGWTPPIEAWRRLAGVGTGAAGLSLEPWNTAWRRFVALAQCAPPFARRVPLTWMRGTPLAVTRESLYIEWDMPVVRAYFSVEIGKCRPSGRETASCFEDRWWAQLRDAFPGMAAERHVPLPGSALHLDVYWPRRQVAVEIQGEPHWRPVARFDGMNGFARRQQRDARKRALCNMLGIALTEVTPGTPVVPLLCRLGNLLGVEPRLPHAVHGS
ncbi:hypothetical protein GX586_14710 [bacterium]|nr:hypothetical protein [bacterium]